MRFLLLVFGCLLVAAGVARAQDSLATARPAAGAAPVAAPAPDTVAALHRLFAHKRTVRTRTGLLTLVGGSSLTAASLDSGPLNPGTNAAFGVAGTGLVLAVEIILDRYGWGRRQEQRTIEAWRRHQLPRYFRRQLTARYFLPDLKTA